LYGHIAGNSGVWRICVFRIGLHVRSVRLIVGL
jgi:hypothetical protein